MGVFEMVIAIVVIGAISSTIQQTIKYRHARGRSAPDVETAGLRDEVRRINERLAVLERLAVEKEGSLEREIERLRDR